MIYQIDILTKTQEYVATIRNLVPIDNKGNILQYISRLSDIGEAKFRVQTKDPIFTNEGDIIKPYSNHVRIKRYGVTVWQGVIVNCPKRNKNFIEVQARSYLYLLDKILIRQDTDNQNERNFKTGQMSTAISSLITDAKADNSIQLSSLTTGTIENPTFPDGYVDSTNNSIAGQQWDFNKIPLKFDFRTVLYVIRAFGMYSNCDYEITNDMVFNYKKYIGNKQPELVFFYGEYGQIDDYDLPLDGESTVNELHGIAADNSFNILHKWQTDTASVGTYGKLQDVAAYGDVKNSNLLATRLLEELGLNSTPDAEIHVVLNDRAYPLGQYGVGDTVTIRVKDHAIDVDEPRRITTISCLVADNGNDMIKLITNKPRASQ